MSFYFLEKYLKNSQKKKYLYVAVFMVFGASLIKPNLIILIVPIIYLTQIFIPVFGILRGWILTFLFFGFNRSLSDLLNNLFLFNLNYPALLSKYVTPPELSKLSIFLLIIFCLVLTYQIILFLKHKTKTISPVILFSAFSVFFIYPKFEKISFIPVIPFILLMLVQVSGKIYHYFHKFTVALFVVLFFTSQIYVLKQYSRNKLASIYPNKTKINKVINILIASKISQENIYILSNNIEYYYYLNQIPPNKYTIIFPWMLEYYPHVPKQIIDGIIKNNIEIIIIPQTNEQINGLGEVRSYINNNFNIIYSDEDVTVYMKNFLASIFNKKIYFKFFI